MKPFLGAFAPDLQERLDEIGRHILEAKGALDQQDVITFWDNSSASFNEIMDILKDVEKGKYADTPELETTLTSMLDDLEVLSETLKAMRKTTGYMLISAEERAHRAPKTFLIPSEKERRSLRPGDLAKLIFTEGEEGERMWVVVTESLGRGLYEGTLANYPVVVASVDFGDKVKFGAEHVASIQRRKPSWS